MHSVNASILRRNAMGTQIAAMWAGVVLAGNLIAPTAKFQASGLSLPVALEVGRVTFRWMLVPEILLALLLIGTVRTWWTAVPVVLLAIQWILVMPPLDARTVDRMQGVAVGPSNLHLVYIGLEMLKLGSLLALCFVSLGKSKS